MKLLEADQIAIEKSFNSGVAVETSAIDSTNPFAGIDISTPTRSNQSNANPFAGISTDMPAQSDTNPFASVDIAPTIPELKKADYSNVGMEFIKGLGAGTEQALGQGLGSPLVAFGEKIQQEASLEIGKNKQGIPQWGKTEFNEFIGKSGKKIQETGIKIRDFFVQNSLKGFEAPNKDIMIAKFGESGYGQRIAYSLGSSVPMMTAAIGVTATTKNPLLGASIFGPQAFGSFYDNARLNGVEVDKAIGLSLANAVSQVGLEVIPLGGWLHKGGGLFKRVLRGAIQEGLIEEGSQQIVQNALEGIGWKGKDVNLLDGVTESIIVGTIMGAGMGIIPSSATIEDLRAQTKKRITKEILLDADKQGLPADKVKTVIDIVAKEIDGIDADKLASVGFKIQEEMTKDAVKELDEVVKPIPTGEGKVELSGAVMQTKRDLQEIGFDETIFNQAIEKGADAEGLIKLVQSQVGENKDVGVFTIGFGENVRVLVKEKRTLLSTPTGEGKIWYHGGVKNLEGDIVAGMVTRSKAEAQKYADEVGGVVYEVPDKAIIPAKQGDTGADGQTLINYKNYGFIKSVKVGEKGWNAKLSTPTGEGKVELLNQLDVAQNKVNEAIKKYGFGGISKSEQHPELVKAVENKQNVFNQVWNEHNPDKSIGSKISYHGKDWTIRNAQFDTSQSADMLKKGSPTGRSYKVSLELVDKQGNPIIIPAREIKLSTPIGEGKVAAFAGTVGEELAQADVVKPSGEIVKRSQIIADLGQRLNVPIRRGGFGGSEASTRGAIGIYKPTPDIIRWKSGGVGTITHEIGHFLDDNFADLKILVRQSQQEIGPLDYDATKQRANEGFSEFLRYWVTQPQVALQKAPKFHAAFTVWLNSNPDIKDILSSAQGQYQSWLAMSPLDKVKSQISFHPEKPKGSIGNTLDSLYDKLADEEAPLKRFAELAKQQGLQVTNEENPYILARLFKGWVGKANHWLMNKTFDTKLKITGKGLKEILEPAKDSLENLSTYLVARRVPELVKRGKTTGITEQDAATTITELNKKYPYFDKLASELYAYQDRLLMYAFENGLVKPEGMVKMKELNQNYVPFYRVFEELQGKGYMGDVYANISSPIKRMSHKGSERDIIDPIESIMKNTYAIINASDRNAVGRAMLVLAKQDKELGRLFEKIATPLTKVASVNLGEEINKIFTEESALSIFGGKFNLVSEDDINMVVDIFRPSFFLPKDSIITVMQGGKKEFYYVDPELYKALLGLEKEEMGMLIKILSYPARWLRAGATTLSPEFLVRNPLRDQFSAYVYSKTGYKPLIDLPRGLFNLLGKSDLYWEWVRGGGEHATIVSVDREYMRNSMVDLFHKNWKDAINPLKWMQSLSETGEQGTRLGDFIRARSKDRSIKEAAFNSREVTLDFAKRGSKIKNWNKIAAFFNATIQGLLRPVQAFQEAPIATSMKVFTGITLPSIILYFINRDDERYKELPRWQKDMFWIIRIPANVPSGEILVRIPKPFELGIIFGSVTERILEYIDSKDPKAFDGIARSVLQGLPDPTPTALVPIIENITNYNLFTGRKLEGMGVERLIPEERYTTFTSETAKKLGRMLGQSPIKIENLMTGYTGGGGQLALNMLDWLVSGGKTKLPMVLETTPLIRGFLAKEPVGGLSESVNKFYESYEKITQAYNTIKELNKTGNIQRAKELQRRFPEATYSNNDKVMDTAKYLSERRKEINKIMDSDKILPVIKLERIRKLAIEMTKEAKRVNNLLK